MTDEKTPRKFPKRKNEIVAALSEEIRALPSGARLPGTADLCRRFRCAVMTISRALGELELRGEIFRLRGKGTFVSSRELREVYVLVPAPNGRWPGNAPVYNRILQEAGRRGIPVHMIYITDDNIPNHIDYASVGRIPVGGAVIVTNYWYHYVFRFLAERRCRVVLFDVFWDLSIQMDSEIAMNWHRLIIPQRAAIGEAVRRLAAAGHRNILYLHRSVHCDTMGIRAFREALRREKIPSRPAWETYGEENYQALYETLMKRLYELPTCNAILARYPLQAEVATVVLGQLKRRIPRDVSVICLEDHPRLLACTPPVTVVNSMPDEAAAGMALDMLAAGPAAGESAMLNFTVADRGSV